MTTSTKANLLAVACLLAVAALARADSDNCKPPTGTQACDPNFEYRTSGRGRTKTGSCVACAAGQYTPKQGLCCKRCDGIISTDAATNATTCTKCPEKSTIFPRPSPTPGLPASTCMCSAGYQATDVSSVTGVTGCTKCPAGKFNPAVTSATNACQACPADSVAAKSGSRACTVCKANSTASEDATSCLCNANYYVRQESKGRGRGRTSGRRLAQAVAASASPADDDYKAPSCVQCTSPTQNNLLNTWPVCCEAGQTYDRLAKKCTTTVCYDGATLVDGACVCPGGQAIANYGSDGTCSCYDGAEWSNTTNTCTCPGGADYTPGANVGDVYSCTCADGASLQGSVCDCGVNVSWNDVAKKCTCPGPTGILTWDASGVCTGCPNGGTWNPTDGICSCPDPALPIWDAASATCVA
uniref:Tyrosine-protein kinase ephrin type A/B receptor-like domain-containing protein n=1 Tax=Tetradesmus obliquus TaxID=3088 RepID=A0A383V3C0_TETOB|eukprot:jgi/Sobl393_1/300/SZX60088.1